MADPSDRVRNLALSQDARTFNLIANIPLPTEGQILVMMPDADFPFEIISLKRQCGGASGSDLTIRLEIDGLIVDFTDTDSAGECPCPDGVLTETEPDGSNYVVPEGGTLEVSMNNLSSDVQDVVIQLKCRRTEENVVVS